jgi:hypothetical protein
LAYDIPTREIKKGGFKKKLISFIKLHETFIIFTIVCGSFWRVDKIQNDITMETEVPK